MGPGPWVRVRSGLVRSGRGPWGRADGAGADATDAALVHGPEDQQDRERELKDREREQKEREVQRAQAERDRESSLYEQGNNALYEGRWDRAVNYFSRLADLKGTRADSALYWKSYAQNRLGQSADALSTIAELTKGYPTSRYIKEARALEVEVRGAGGQPMRPEAQADEEMQIIAMNALANSDPAQAVPLLERKLSGTASPRLKGQALYVLAQINDPRAREVLINIAKGSAIPGAAEPRDSVSRRPRRPREPRHARRDLRSSTDVDVKRRILRAFMAAGEKDRLLTAAQTEQNPELRAEAVRQLGADGRQRRALADVSEGIVGRRQTADSVGHAGQRQHRRG